MRGSGMKRFHVVGLGNAIVDLFVDSSEAEFAKLNFERGTMRLVEADEQKEILAKFLANDPRLVSGGSVANSIIALSQLGGKAGFIGCVGDDRYGMFYEREFTELGIDIGNPIIVGQTTGTCVCVITPDAERTMRTCLAVSSHLNEKHVDEVRIKDSEWLFIEGYVFANPATGQGAIREAIRLAKLHGTKIALTCSDAFVPAVFHEPFMEALRQSDLLFCNATEAAAVAKTESAKDAFAKLKSIVPSCVVTDGPEGAYIRVGSIEGHVPAVTCTPKDLTGAGDMFAGAFLYGITHHIDPLQAAKAANYLSMKVITQVGARLHSGTKEFWNEIIA
jgi:sugar/nucleoside kinase (ribokinase family)